MKEFRSKLSLKAIIIGSLTDVIGTNIWGAIFFIWIIFAFHLNTLPAKAMTVALTNIIEHNVALNSLNMIVGAGFSVLGGYVAASIAKKHVLLNATLASFLCILSTFFALSAGIWLVLLSLIGNPLLTLFGGYIYLRRSAKTPRKTRSSH